MEPSQPVNDPARLMERIGDQRSWLREDAWRSGGESLGSRRDAVVSTSIASWGEWRFRDPAASISILRTVAVFPNQRFALLADQGYGTAAEWTSRWPLAQGVEAAADKTLRTIRLNEPGQPRRSALVIPLALPSSPYPAAQGAIATEEGSLDSDSDSDSDSDLKRSRDLILTQAQTQAAIPNPRKRRWWMPIIVSWDAPRNCKPLFWRVLTVSQKSRICGPNIAFGVRVSWDDETYLIYRSLAAPVLRTVLGHQTKARMLVARFNLQGLLEPILQVRQTGTAPRASSKG